MNKKWMLGFMGCISAGLMFVTIMSILPGCAGQVPSVTTFMLTSTVTRTPTVTKTPTP